MNGFIAAFNDWGWLWFTLGIVGYNIGFWILVILGD